MSVQLGYTSMFSYLNGKNDDQFMGQFIWAPHVQSQFIQWWDFFLARQSTIYFDNCPIFNLPFTEVSTDLTVVEHCCQLPALSRASNLRRLHNPNQFPDSGGHWGAQRKFPAVALTLVILGGIMSWTEKPHDPTGLPCCANDEQVS